MKTYLSPFIATLISFQSFALVDNDPAVAKKEAAQIATAQYISPAMMIKLATMLTALSKVDHASLMADGQITTNEIKDLSEQATLPEEKEMLLKMAELVKTQKLEPMIRIALVQLMSNEKIMNSKPELAVLKTLSPEKKEYAIKALVGAITSVVQIRGLDTTDASSSYKEWVDLSFDLEKALDGSKSNDILEFADTRWTTSSEVKQLINGPESFQLKDSLILNAKKSIDVLTWSIYDDFTGSEAMKMFLKKQKQDHVKVRIIVDGQVASTAGHGNYVTQLEKEGIEVVRWFSKKRPFYGQHRKMIIIDDQHVVAGGMNFGDVYSHKNPDEKSKWRDTDFYFNGNSAIEAKNLFAHLWNEQVRSFDLKYKQIAFQKPSNVNESYKLALINSEPYTNKKAGSTVLLTLLKAIRQASTSIDIENAYIIVFPTLKNELAKAISRKVRLLTNSPESVDEPIVSLPILRSANMMVEENAQVYLKRGDTLHSKFAIIDGKYTMILSYNLHPRSEKVEGEMAVLFDNQEVAARLTKAFENDISSENAIDLNHDGSKKWKDSPLAIPALRIFFDLL